MELVGLRLFTHISSNIETGIDLLELLVYGVLDKHLGDNKLDYLVGNKLTIVTIFQHFVQTIY